MLDDTKGARYLLGIEPLDDTMRFLAQHSPSEWEPADLARRHQRAWTVRRDRSYHPPTVAAPPASWTNHIARLQQRPLFQQLVDREGVRIAEVGLADLIPIQPHVHFAYARERTAAPGTALSLCLSADPEPISVQGGITEDRDDLAFTVTTPDLNLGVTEAHLDPSNGVEVSFRISRTSVFCQAMQVGTRLILKDGTHRAVGLLAQGAATLPCLLTEHAEPWQLPSHLDPALLLGPHPPLMRDFLDPALYVPHAWPLRRKVIRIRVDQFVLTDE